MIDFIEDTRFSVQNADALEAELSGYVARLRSDQKDMQARLNVINADKMLSDAGKKAKIAELYAEKKSALDAFRGELTANLDGRASNMRRALDGAVKLPSMDTARQRWICDFFATVDPVLRGEHLKQAIAAGDLEIVAAVLDAPKCLNLIAESVRHDVAQRLQAAAAPEYHATAMDVESLRQVMRANLKRYERALEPLRTVALQVDPGRFDPLVRRARGLE